MIDRTHLITPSYYYIIVTCEPRNFLKNGQITYNTASTIAGRKFVTGVQITFSCNYGYHLTGPSKGVCGSRGTWSGHNAQCIRSMS